MTLKYFFLLLLSFTFFIQQVLALSFYSNETSGNQPNGLLTTEKYQAGIHFAREMPPRAELTAVEMELEEDETLNNAFQELTIDFFSHHYGISSYDAVLRTRYLQLLSAFEQQPSAPLFVLHHSWKSSLV